MPVLAAAGLHANGTGEAQAGGTAAGDRRDPGWGPDRAGDQVFYDRLGAFRGLDRRLDELGDCKIIPSSPGVRRPEELKLRTLRIAERDLWGAWRDEFAPPEPTPRRTDLLVRLGVALNELTAALSKAFFGWLSEQSSSVIYGQLRQALRHLVDPARGPFSWWSRTETNLRCLPVRHAGDRFRLVSWAEVQGSKGRILLPDWGSAPKRDPALMRRRRLKLFKKAIFGGVPLGTDRDLAQLEIPEQLEMFSSDIMGSCFGANPHAS